MPATKKTDWSFSNLQLRPIIAVNVSQPQGNPAEWAAPSHSAPTGASQFMSLSLNPGFFPPVTAPAAHPVRNPPMHSAPVEAVVVEEHASEREVKRPTDYVAALRELREEQPNSRHHLAARTYLQVAHYEGDFPLVDVYT